MAAVIELTRRRVRGAPLSRMGRKIELLNRHADETAKQGRHDKGDDKIGVNVS